MTSSRQIFAPFVCCLLAVLGLFAHQVTSDETLQVSASHSPLLNSERIRQRYGNYGIDVLEQDERLRVSNLYSLEEGAKITRTLAVVLYPAEVPSDITAEHELIVAGGSIGQVFKERGWQVEKTVRYLGIIPASADFDEIYTLMGGITPADLAVLLYDFSVCNASGCFAYTTIAEVYHPDYLGQEDLRAIYGDQAVQPADVDQTEATLDTVMAVMAGG